MMIKLSTCILIFRGLLQFEYIKRSNTEETLLVENLSDSRKNIKYK